MSTSASTMIMRISELELLLVCSHLSSILYQRLRRCVMLVSIDLGTTVLSNFYARHATGDAAER